MEHMIICVAWERELLKALFLSLSFQNHSIVIFKVIVVDYVFTNAAVGGRAKCVKGNEMPDTENDSETSNEDLPDDWASELKGTSSGIRKRVQHGLDPSNLEEFGIGEDE